MAFLSDLGRSNAISSVNTLANTAIQLKGLQNQDEQRQYENAINLEKLGMAKETHTVDMRQKEIAATEAETEQKRLDSPYDITTDPRFLALPKEGQDAVLKHAVANKYTDQAGIGTVRSSKRLLSDTEGNPTLFKESMGPLVQAKKAATLESWNALQEAKAAGDEKKIATATAQYKRSLADYNASNGTFLDHANKLDLEEQKQGAIKNAKVAADPNSSTGFSYFGSDGSILLRGAPKPSSDVAGSKLTETERHNKAMEVIRKAAGTGVGKPTALVQNTEFLATLGWDKKEAAKLLSGSKPMSRDSFIGQVTGKIMSNELVPEDEKANRVKEAISVYDTFMTKPGASPTSASTVPKGKPLDQAMATSILQEAGGDKEKARKIAKDRGYSF